MVMDDICLLLKVISSMVSLSFLIWLIVENI